MTPRHFVRISSVLVVASLILASPLKGDIVAADSFTYPDSPLYGSNGGIGWINSWGGFGMDLLGGQVVLSAAGNPSSYGNRVFDNPASTPNLFFSIDLSIGAFGGNDYFGVLGSLGANIPQIAFGKLAGSNRFQVGNGGYSSSETDILPNSNYHLIGAYSHSPGTPGSTR